MSIGHHFENFKTSNYLEDLNYPVPAPRLGALSEQPKIWVSDGSRRVTGRSLKKTLDSGVFIVILGSPNKQMATAYFNKLEGNADVWSIDIIRVFPEYRGRGYSSKILEFVKNEVLPIGTMIHGDVYSKLIYKNICGVFGDPIKYKKVSGERYRLFSSHDRVLSELDDLPVESGQNHRIRVHNARHVDVIWRIK